MLQTILADLLSTLYYHIGFGIIFGFLTMVALPSIVETGIKATVKTFWKKLRSDCRYLIRFLFFVCLYIVLAKTLICRTIWQSPWENVLGEWWIYTTEGEINTEGIENLVMFIPLSFCYYLSFDKKYSAVNFWRMCQHSIKYSFLFSLFIECGQLLLRLGTFQVSDLAQNTAGGLIGALLYYVICRVEKRQNS